MSGRDEEFDDFLARRRPLFPRPSDEVFGPPEEVDRLVLRQAREAIETEKPPRVFRGLQWGAPLAVAATLLVAFTIVLQVDAPRKEPVPEVIVQQVSQRLEPVATAAPADSRAAADAAGAPASDGAVAQVAPEFARGDSTARPGSLVSQGEASRHAPPAPPPPVVAARPADASREAHAGSRALIGDVGPPMATSRAPAEAERTAAAAPADTPWRRDEKSWLAQIERLRAEGKHAEADAELAEYQRQHRAFAVAPDR